MWAGLRSRYLHFSATSLPSSSLAYRLWKLGFSGLNHTFSSSSAESSIKELLSLQEVEKVLRDVSAGGVTVLPVGKQCDWADLMVIATVRSTWHVKNIVQALIYEEQKGAKRMRGQETGKWVVVDWTPLVLELNKCASAFSLSQFSERVRHSILAQNTSILEPMISSRCLCENEVGTEK